MEIDYKSKWNNYTPGDVSWINDRKTHPCRKLFVDYVSNISHGNRFRYSVLEIGAGELLEAKKLEYEACYVVCDISKTFLKHASHNGIGTIESCMTDIKTDKFFNIVYMCSVLEHTPNIVKTIESIKKISEKYFITLFKWTYKNVECPYQSIYHPKRGYFSTEFNINDIVRLLKEHSKIEFMTVTGDNIETMSYKKYYSTLNEKQKNGLHRNGNYLSICGVWK